MTDINPLEQKILDTIKAGGPITFERFMEMALYEPGLGYYMTDKAGIGKSGDFYTSQHVHPIFGSMIGRQIIEIWEYMGKPGDFLTVEPGPGEGFMCLDILSFLKKKDILRSMTYVIVELNPWRQKRQKKLLANYSGSVRWVSSLDDLGKFRGCIISNELLDAFPAHLIQMRDELKEIYVNAEDSRLGELECPPSTDAIFNYISEFSLDLPSGYRTEINLRIKDWLKSVQGNLEDGFIVTIDYGYPSADYYAEERNRGTLLCYHRHQFSEDPYIHIGEQDMTAHVNFSSVKKWGEELGFGTVGFCQQGPYLVALGIDEVIQETLEQNREYLFEIAKIKRLILPGTLGETHKVLIQYKGTGVPALRGFSMKNQKNLL
jgi:SAM-dependent MidA family methyltransferase